MFEVNDDFELDADFLDDVFASEQEAAVEKKILPTDSKLSDYRVKQPANNIIDKSSCFNSTNRIHFNNNSDSFLLSSNNISTCQIAGDRNLPSSSNDTPKRGSITSARFPLSSRSKRQRKFPGPAGLLSENNVNNGFILPANDLDFEDSPVAPTKDDLCSQGTLSGSELEKEPWQSFLSDLGSQQDVLTVLNIASVKKSAAASLLARRKVPFVAAVLQHIDTSAPDPCIVLRDVTGEIHCTLHRNVWDEFGAELNPGCVVVLRNVGVLSTGFTSRRHYLNITANNLVTLYTPSKGKVQLSEVDKVSNLNFLKFIEEWRATVNPVQSPASLPSPCNALSLFSASPQTINQPVGNRVPWLPTADIHGENISRIGTATSRVPGSNFGHSKTPIFTRTIQNCSQQSRLQCTPNITSSSVIQSKSVQRCLKPLNVTSNLNPAKQSEVKQYQWSVPKTSSNYKGFDQNIFSQSRNGFLSSDLNSVASHTFQFSGNENSDANFLRPSETMQSKKPKICVTDSTDKCYNGLQWNSFSETNGSVDMFNCSESNPQSRSDNKDMDMFSLSSQSTIVFTRHLEDDEKSVVESVLDGFDTEALFDDF